MNTRNPISMLQLTSQLRTSSAIGHRVGWNKVRFALTITPRREDLYRWPIAPDDDSMCVLTVLRSCHRSTDDRKSVPRFKVDFHLLETRF